MALTFSQPPYLVDQVSYVNQHGIICCLISATTVGGPMKRELIQDGWQGIQKGLEVIHKPASVYFFLLMSSLFDCTHSTHVGFPSQYCVKSYGENWYKVKSLLNKQPSLYFYL